MSITRTSPPMIRCALMLALLLPLHACAKEYSADDIEAQVVDADTKAPIAGVVVVAHWELQSGLEGGNIAGNVMVLETKTDDSGRFHFPSWGPVKVRRGWLSNVRLESADPEMYLFRSGYQYLAVRNNRTIRELVNDPSHRTSDWNGKTLELKKFTGSLNDYAMSLVTPSYELDTTMGPQCTWTKIPQMISAMEKQSKIFADAGVHVGTLFDSLKSNEESLSKQGCSFATYSREHGL